MRYRITPDQTVYFVTWTVVDWLPVFVSEAACGIITDSFRHCQLNKHLCINAYVIMPTHVHAILFDEACDSARLSRTLADMRKYTGRMLLQYCREQMPPCYDLCFEAAAGRDRERQFWQSGMQPEAIRTAEFWKQKVEYIHENPCRSGLVREPQAWRFSSAAYWLEGGESEVVLSALEE